MTPIGACGTYASMAFNRETVLRNLERATLQQKIEDLELKLIQLKNQMFDDCTCVGHLHSGASGQCFRSERGSLSTTRCSCRAK